MGWKFGLLIALLPCVSTAESVIALRTIPAKSIVSEGDIGLVDAAIDGALTETRAALGFEARMTIYAGRPLRGSDLVAPAMVERNQSVRLIYKAGSLTISAQGRALARGAKGDLIRVMNLTSKTTVTGTISWDGSIIVGDWK